MQLGRQNPHPNHPSQRTRGATYLHDSATTNLSTMPATPDPNAKSLATHLHVAARSAGYDLDQPRSGATKEIASRSGIPQSTVSRIFSGEMIPKPSTLQALADTLHLDVVDLLVVAGLISPRSDRPTPPALATHTAEDAARLLDIHDDDVPLFVAFVNRLRESPQPHTRG